MCGLFRREKSPKECVEEIINKYFNSELQMSDADYRKLKGCLEKWNSSNDPDFLGAMAYVKYREGELNDMWSFIEMDLHLDLGDEEHGAFIPAMMTDMKPELKYEIIKKIHERTRGIFSLNILARIAKKVGKEKEVLQLVEEYEKANPRDRRIKKILKALK